MRPAPIIFAARDPISTNSTRITRGGALTDAYHRISKGPNQQSDSSLTLGYNHQDDDTIVKAALQHSDTVNLVDKSFQNAFVYPQTAPGYERIFNKAGHSLNQATFDYARPVAGIGQVSMGVEYRRDANRIGNYFASIDPLTDAEIVDLDATHRYQVIDTQKAAYITAQVTWASRWEALIGVRFETVTTRMEGETRAAILGTSYQSLNPSLHLKYSLDGDKSLSLSYRQSLQRPDPRDLSPYTTYWDAQNLFVGNPNLKPQPVKSLELTYDASREDLSRSLGVFLPQKHRYSGRCAHLYQRQYPPQQQGECRQGTVDRSYRVRRLAPAQRLSHKHRRQYLLPRTGHD